MPNRTYAIGDVHGDLDELHKLFELLPTPRAEDTIVFLGDYLDRGPNSAGVVDFVRNELPKRTEAKIVTLRGNHEDGWLSVIDAKRSDDPDAFGFLLMPTNGCAACWRSFVGGDKQRMSNFKEFTSASFFPSDVVEWMRALPLWYEDRHAIYVHAGLRRVGDHWLHPKDTRETRALLWERSEEFFTEYREKRVVCGHTPTHLLPQEHSVYTPDDPSDLWATKTVLVVDTGCGKGGFLTCLQLPELLVYESRDKRKG